MRIGGLLTGTVVLFWTLAGCGGDSTGPSSSGYSIAIQAGDAQFATPGAQLAEPLQVVVTDPVSKKAKDNVVVTWTITSGTGAVLSTVSSTTGSNGVASTQLTVGSALGTYKVQATTAKLVGSPVEFTAKAVNPPALSSVAPTSANAGDTVSLTGQNFSPTADENIVLFGGFRGRVITATATSMRVIVPLCVPTRSVAVQVLLGAVSGNQLALNVTGSTGSALQMTRGQVQSFSDPNALGCFRLPGNTPGLTLLLVPQNYSQVVGSLTAIQLNGLTSGAPSAFARPLPVFEPTTDFPSDWEIRLRKREQQMLQGPIAFARPQPSLVAACSATQLGDRCNFQVLDKDDHFVTVTAEVKAISTHSIVFQDIQAPANGLLTSDFNTLASVFDDPIYNTDVAVFGQPSDLDNNGKVIILLTPVVNALTPKGSTGFIAGFFYGCDLLPKSSCSGTNSGEIFYALTADPTAQYGDARTRQTVITSLPPVLAHEFQHMINFYQRGNSTDALWLAEGMAHDAEDVVGDVFAARGDLANAALFKAQNTGRANRFLRATGSYSLLAEEDVGTLEQRGGAYLFVRYMQGQYGDAILKQLTASKLSSVTNVTTQTGKTWSSLLSDWSVALWADNAPELAGVTMPKQFTFPNENLRQRFANSDGSYPLKPSFFSFQDFAVSTTLPASSETYVLLQAQGSSPSPLNLTFTGQRGGAFAINAAPQLTILRVQ